MDLIGCNVVMGREVVSFHKVPLILWVGKVQRFPFPRGARMSIIRLHVRIYWSISCGNNGKDERDNIPIPTMYAGTPNAHANNLHS